MGELEGSDLNKTESSLEVVPEEHSPVLEKESDTLNTISQEPNDDQ
ncbi:remorin, partial [Trifolium medium]|nr:remorin [Trifolium medium]